LQESSLTKFKSIIVLHIIATYTVGYCSINSSEIVIYRYSKDDGLSSKHVCKFFWNIKTAFQFKQNRQPLITSKLSRSKALFLNMYLDLVLRSLSTFLLASLS